MGGTFDETYIFIVPFPVPDRRRVMPSIFINTFDKSVPELVKYPDNPEDITYNSYLIKFVLHLLFIIFIYFVGTGPVLS